MPKKVKEESKEKLKKILIPKDEISFDFFRSCGPGGQNVNKVSTGVRLRWNIKKSNFIDEKLKKKIENKYKTKITKHGELILESEEERSQFQNKKRVLEKLNLLIKSAAKEKRKRKPKTVCQKTNEERLKEKKKISLKKKMRQKVKPEEYV